MKITHWVKKENSGLFRTTLELANYEIKAGHQIALREPTGQAPIYGTVQDPDIELVHSQLPVESYHNGKPRGMWMHGEPLSSVGNKVSMKAILDLAPLCDFFVCMRKDELQVWESIKRTYLVDKGIDLDLYKPLEGVTERLAGEPAVIYVENWRGSRNPLYLCVAMQQVWRKYPKARLHLYNCNDPRMNETFKALIKNNKWWPFIRSLKGHEKDINMLYNRADIVVSCLYPLYARSIEAFGAGKAFIGPGYKEHDYPFVCDLDPASMADAIIKCWENYDQIDYRQWAKDHHNVENTVKQSLEIYQRYL